MPRFLTTLALALAAAVGPLPVAAPLAAQRLGKPVARPKLRDVPDTNDAQAYFDAGVRVFRDDPAAAADAFYWAARINPGWGDPLYGRRVALLAQKRNLMQAVMTGNRRSRPELLALDTLQARALMLNPFLYRRLDGGASRADARPLPAALRPVLVFGRVPLFYFLLHFLIIHLLAVAVSAVRYGSVRGMFESPSLDRFPITQPPGWPLSLPWVYAAWAAVVVLAYPACRWYAALKARSTNRWLSYL